jgi:phosphohistidine phosphatase
MKTLYLLRHAHAMSRGTDLSDFDRPLNERGWEEAKEIATYLQNKKLTFDLVLCSASLRTQETLEPLRPVVGTEQLDISESYYNISEEEILHHLKHLPEKATRVLYIGHNPGIAFAILRLAKTFPDFLKEGVHPATLVGFHFALEKWKDLAWQSGEIVDLFQPILSPSEPPGPMEP